MIQSEWFDDDYTTTVFDDIVETYNLGDIVDARLADPAFNPMRGYAMGGLNADYTKFISGKHISAQTDQNNDCYITDTIKSTAAPSQSFWGFGVWNTNYLDVPCWFNESAGRWGETSALNPSPLFVKEMRAYALRYVTAGVQVQFKICNPQSVDIQIDGGGSYSCYVTAANGYENLGQSMYLSFSDLREFVENGQSITVTDNDHGSFSLRYSDLIDGRYWQQGNYFIFCELIGSTSITARYDQYTNDSRIQPIISTKCGDNIILLNPFGFLFGNTQLAVSDKFGDDQLRIVYWTQNTYDSYNAGYNQDVYAPLGNYFLGADEFDLPVGFFDYMNRLANFQYVIDTNNNGLVWYYTGPNSYITVGGRTCWRYKTRPVIDFDILYFVFGLLNRVQDPDDSTAPTARYVTDDFISIYTNNIPNPEFIVYTGNYDPIVPRLMDWQQYGHDISEDDYEPEEPGPGPGPRPEPVPPGSDENGGDDITLPSIAGLGGGFGFTTQYALRGSQLEQLGQALWAGFDTNNPDIDAYLQNFVYRVDPNTGSVNMADIMSFFISLRAYPMPLGNLASITAAGTDMYIGAGTAPLRKSDGTTPFTQPIHTLDSYLEEVDAGSVSVPFWFGDYRDYSTEIILYLPYCGTAELNPGDVMGGTLTATYVIDLSTGSCTAYVMCSTWDGKNYPVAVLPGQMGVDIPITATNAGRVGARLLGDRINVAENILSGVKSGITGIGAIMSGNFAGAVRSGMQTFLDTSLNEQKLLAGMAERGAISAPMLSGGRGLAAFKNPMTAYVQVRSPFYAVPDNYADTVGNPAAVAVTIGNCSGFCKFYNVDVTGITTDADDQQAIRAALETGIII